MDGTILDTLQDLANAVNYSLACNGFSTRTVDEVRRFVGNGVIKLIDRASPSNISFDEKKKIQESFFSYYSEHCSDNTKPYDGIIELLKKLRSKKIKIAVNSNKPDFAVKKLCKQYFNGLFDIEIGSRDGVRNKPYPDSVNQVLYEEKIEKSAAIYVGDSDVDIETAKNAGIDGIGVEWGFRGKDFLLEHGAITTVENTDELIKILGV